MAQDEGSRSEGVAEHLNLRCRQAVRVAASGAPGGVQAFAARLRREADTFAVDGGTRMAGFLNALARLVEGAPLELAIEGVQDPFRTGLRSVAADMAEARRRAAPTAETEPPEAEAVAQLASRVATVLRARDRNAARALAEALDEAGRTPGLDPDAGDYLLVLRDVLAGRKVQAQALALAEPYRSAYFSLDLLMRGASPLPALLERVRHNAVLVLASGNPEARAALDAVLADLEARARHADGAPPRLADFVAAVRDLLGDGAGTVAAGTVAPAGVGAAWQPRRFDDAHLDAAWQGIGRVGASTAVDEL